MLELKLGACFDKYYKKSINKLTNLCLSVNPSLIYVFFYEMSTHVLESSLKLAWGRTEQKKKKNCYQKFHLSSTRHS